MVTRREFMAASGTIAGAASLGAGSARAAPAAPGPFRHGVASGDPLADRVILWTRVTPQRERATPVRWLIAEDEALRRVVNQGLVSALPERDFTVKVDADGLQPGRTYWYRFEAEGAHSVAGRTRTLPALDVDQVRFAVASCSNYASGFFNAYGRIAERDELDAVLHLGDYLYEYPPDAYGSNSALGRTHRPARELVALADYRERYAQYRSDPDLQAAHRQHPWICVWDDHESANNAWRDGAQNHQPEEGDWGARRTAAVRAYHEWLPIRERPGAGGPQIWRSFGFGRLADLIMLDTRLHGRSQQVGERTDRAALEAPGRSLLGPDQAAWLAEELRASVRRGSAWHVIGQQLMFGQLVDEDGAILNADQWDGYPESRRLVLDQLAGEAIDDTIILTGDIHSAWALDIARDPFGDDYDGATGRGSLAVELVTTSVTSPGPMAGAPPADVAAREQAIVASRPHIRYVNMRDHGYLLLDLDAERARAEWWLVEGIDRRLPGERLGAAFVTRRGTNHLIADQAG